MGSFTTRGQKSEQLVLAPNQSLSVVLTGTLTGAITLERAGKGLISWATVATYASPSTSTYYNRSGKDEVLRLSVASIGLAQTVTYTLSQVTGEIVQEFFDKNNVRYAYIDDLGVYHIDNAASSGGGGWTKYAYTFTDFDSAAESFEIVVASIDAREFVENVVLRVGDEWNVPGSALQATLGLETLNNLIDGEDIDSQSDVFYIPNENLIANNLQVGGLARDLRLMIAAIGSTTDQLTQGSIDIFIKTSTLPT